MVTVVMITFVMITVGTMTVVMMTVVMVTVVTNAFIVELQICFSYMFSNINYTISLI